MLLSEVTVMLIGLDAVVRGNSDADRTGCCCQG